MATCCTDGVTFGVEESTVDRHVKFHPVEMIFGFAKSAISFTILLLLKAIVYSLLNCKHQLNIIQKSIKIA